MVIKKSHNPNYILESLRKPEFWIGIITFSVVLSVFIYMLQPYFEKVSFKTSKKETIVSPIPKEETAVKKMENNELKKVVKAADTGFVYYTVVNGDSYWTISKKVCGTGVFFEEIQKLNDMPLQPGDQVVVDCQ